jgi:hypothetical protein
MYYSNAQPVNAATVQLEGPTTLMGQTDPTGAFLFTDLDPVPWQIVPQKLGDVGSAVTALDAVYVLQAVVGMRTLSPEQTMACDVNGSGTLSSLDATLILQYAAGTITDFPVAHACGSDWAFMPDPAPTPNQQLVEPVIAAGACQGGSIAFQPLAGEANSQNFLAIAFGDCTGNWQARGSAAVTAPERLSVLSPSVRLGRIRTDGRKTSLMRVPLYVHGSYNALDFELQYNPNRLTARGVYRADNTREALVAANQQTPGVLRVALASATPLRGGTALILQFEGTRARSPSALRITRATVGEE